MATNKDLKRWYDGGGSEPKDFVRLNDEAKIDGDLIPGGGSGGGMQMDLLWENASPTSNFSSQVITLNDVSQYKLFLIAIYSSQSAGKNPTNVMLINEIDQGTMCYDSYGYGSRGNRVCYQRKILRYGEGFWIDTCYLTPNIGSAWDPGSTNNAWCVPYKIYGIK